MIAQLYDPAKNAASQTIAEKLMHWMLTGETGSSSKVMAAVAAGIPVQAMRGGGYPSHPLDPSDLNRCIKLVDAIPEIEACFPDIATLSDSWARVIQHWDILRHSFHSEVGHDWCRGTAAPKTYALMKGLGL